MQKRRNTSEHIRPRLETSGWLSTPPIDPSQTLDIEQCSWDLTSKADHVSRASRTDPGFERYLQQKRLTLPCTVLPPPIWISAAKTTDYALHSAPPPSLLCLSATRHPLWVWPRRLLHAPPRLRLFKKRSRTLLKRMNESLIKIGNFRMYGRTRLP